MSDSDSKQSVGEAARDIAEKALQGIKQFGENVVDASKDFVESAKLKTQGDDVRKEIDENYLKLGKLVYQSGNLTGKQAEISDHIHELYSKLQNIEMARNDT